MDGRTTTPFCDEEPRGVDHSTQHNQQHDPLIRTPPEIISLIFRSAAQYDCPDVDPLNYEAVSREIQHYLRAAVWLASVCSRWRQVAISDSSLWTTVNVSFYGYSGGDIWAPSLELVEEWLRRSGGLPLRIVFNWAFPRRDEDQELANIIAALCKHCHRWKTLCIRLYSKARSWFEAARSADVIELDCLYIEYFASNCLPSLGSTVLRPRHALLPRLSNVKEGAISWANLVSLHIMTTPNECLNVIRNARRLETLQYCIDTRHNDESTPPPYPVQARHLQTLHVKFLSNVQIRRFFVHLGAPELQALHLLKRSMDGSEVALGCLDSLLIHGENQLRKLTLDNTSVSSLGLLHLLNRLSKLEHLEFSQCYSHYGAQLGLCGLLNYLTTTGITINNLPCRFLPQLSHLTYKGPRTFHWTAIYYLVQVHNKPLVSGNRRPLKYISLELQSTIDLPKDCIDSKELLELRAVEDVRVGLHADLLRSSFEHHGLAYPQGDSSFPKELIVRPNDLLYV